MKFLKCALCGNVIEVVEDKGGPLMCCGQPMNELKANTTDGALEKHVPAAQIIDGNLHVQVGSVEHPMLPEHYITFVAVEAGDTIYRKALKPGEKPEATFALNGYKGKVVVYELCNIHGLWKTELEA
ncbi:MAG: desulfoferrodoxin family protein [Longicatena sp.]